MDGIVARFSERLDTLFAALKPFFSSCFYAIEAGNPYDLDKAKISGIIDDALNGIDIAFTKIKDAFADCALDFESNSDETDALGAAYIEQDALLMFRGHFLLNFLAKFLSKEFYELRERYKRREITRLRKRAANECDAASLFGRLAALATCPVSFDTALARVLAVA